MSGQCPRTGAFTVGLREARTRYVVRPAAARKVVHARTGLDSLTPAALRRFCQEREQLAGKNGRIAECLIVALPIEVTPQQRVDLVKALAEQVTKGQAPYLAALHDKERDARNPHAHILLFDETAPARPGARGRRPKIIGLSRKNALEDVRAVWSALHNRMVSDWGYDETSAIDHRSLRDQGKPRIPQLHEGAAIRAMTRQGKRPTSRSATDSQGRSVDWPKIDGGNLRPETNCLVREVNMHRALGSRTAPEVRDRVPTWINQGPPSNPTPIKQTQDVASSPSYFDKQTPDTGRHQPWWLPSWAALFKRSTERGKYKPTRLRRLLEALRSDSREVRDEADGRSADDLQTRWFGVPTSDRPSMLPGSFRRALSYVRSGSPARGSVGRGPVRGYKPRLHHNQ